MKNLLVLFTISITTFLSAQNKDLDNLQSQINANKAKIETLQSSVNAVTTENIYLKDVLDIQKPIKEASVDDTTFKVIAVKGDKKSKNVRVEILVESSSDKNQYFGNSKVSIIDILGNHYKHSESMSKNHRTMQYKNVPVKMTFGFYQVQEEPQFIKIFTWNMLLQYEDEQYNSKNSLAVQFRDLPIDWK